MKVDNFKPIIWLQGIVLKALGLTLLFIKRGKEKDIFKYLMGRTAIYVGSFLSFLILASCSLPKKFASGNQIMAKEKGTDFVQLNDGKILSTERITSSFTSKKEIKTSEGLTLSGKDVKAFQSERGYFAKVVKNDLNETGFLFRVSLRVINVYRSEGSLILWVWLGEMWDHQCTMFKKTTKEYCTG